MAWPNKVAVLVESLYIPEELEIYSSKLQAAGMVVELVARLWGQPKITIYSDNVSDIPTGEHRTLEQLDVTVDVQTVLDNLDDYAAVMIAANYTSVRGRHFTKEDGSPRDAPAVKLVAAAMRRRGIVKSALCHGLWAATPNPEVIAGRRVICHEVVRADILNAGAIITETENRVVRDGDLVTGYSKHEAGTLADEVITAIRHLRDAGMRSGSVTEERPRFELPSLEQIDKRRILVLLSEWGYWGEELLGPLDVFDAAGYEVHFCTPTGRRPNAIPVSMDPDFIDPPLQRPVTTAEVAARVRLLDDPETELGRRLESRLNLAELLPERPYAATPSYIRSLEVYNRRIEAAIAELTHQYDALLVVGGSGPLMDLANNGRVHSLLLGFVGANKLVGAECYGVGCLAFARDWETRDSILRGKFVTGHCLEYDYHAGTAFVKERGRFLMDGDEVFDFGPPPYPLEHILRDATGPDGGYVGNLGKETSVVVDYPFVTGRSTPDSYLTGQKMVEALEVGLRRWGIPNRAPEYDREAT